MSTISDLTLHKPPMIKYSNGSRLSLTPHHTSLSRSTSRSSSRLSLATSFASQPTGPSIIPSANSSSLQSQSRIQVTVRPRPAQEQYVDTPWVMDHSNSQIGHPEIGHFQYDHVFSTNDDNQDVFEISAVPVIRKCLNGFNGTIFAYGMTSSGKTYSMRGVVERSVQLIFDYSQKENDQEGSHVGDSMDEDPKQSWIDENLLNDNTILAGDINNAYTVEHVKCSILEIYNEKLKDLLSSNHLETANRRTSGAGMINELKIVEDSRLGIKVRGLSEIEVVSPAQLLELINQGERLRSTDSTDYNYTSSRSHFIVTLKIFLKDSNGADIVSMLNFCDLAGSERATSDSDRRKEGSFINKSLLALGTVITKLSENSTSGSVNNSHIPYRDSKLTRFLQPSLQGGSMISILCTIHLGNNVVGETTNTLRFGSRAKNVMLSLKRNTGDIDIVKVLKQNETLKSEVCRLRSILDSGMTSYTDATSFQMMKTEERDIPSSKKEDVHYELIAENNILNEQVEHLKRLQIEDNLIRSKQCDDDLSSLNEILAGLILDANTRRTCDELMGRIGRNHREYDLRLQEQDSYVGHLENRIRISEIENARHKPVLSPSVTPVTTASAAESPTYDRELIEELQEELAELKRSMQRKDAMIRALQRTGNV